MHRRSPALTLTSLLTAATGAVGLVALGSGSTAAAGTARPAPGPGRDAAPPRLVVLISIDQCRADYITRFSDLYLPPGRGRMVGGFRYLQTQGAWYPDCQYQHHRTVTAAGHAILGTGAQPYVNGIVGNAWWDRATGKSVYCVDDNQSEVVGATSGSKETPMSARNLLVSTVGDELELATGGLAKTVSLSLKDRASILLSGHRSDTVLWFDETTGGWVTSTAYAPDKKLAGWVEELNGNALAAELKRTPWTPSVDSAALRRVWNPDGKSVTFNHSLEGTGYGSFTTSPAGNRFVFESCKKAVKAEKLGQDEIPDLLTINLASNDYVGHKYGPDSPEVLDISVQTDRQLADFFRYLEDVVPGGLDRVTIALSSDHGCANVPEVLAGMGVTVARAISADIAGAAEKALDTAIGPAKWIASGDNGELYFSPAALSAYPKEPRPRLEQVAAEAVRAVPGVYMAIGKSAVLSGQVPRNALGSRITQGVHPDRSGDVVILLHPHWLSGSKPVGTGTSHGVPFTYDTHVPLLMAGAGVRKGTYLSRVSPAQVAPTLSYILGIARPGAADEPLLPGLAGAVE